MDNQNKLNNALQEINKSISSIKLESSKNLSGSCSVACSIDRDFRTFTLRLLINADLEPLTRKRKNDLKKIRLDYLHKTRDVLMKNGLPQLQVNVTIDQGPVCSLSQNNIDDLVNGLKSIESLQGFQCTHIMVKGQPMSGKYETLIQILARASQRLSTVDQFNNLIRTCE